MGFIDDVIKNVKTGIDDIQSKSNDLMQQVSINNRINSLEGKKQALLINIGQLVYDKYEKGDEVSEDLLKDKVKELALVEKDIDAARAELKQVKESCDQPNAPRSEKAAHSAGYKPTPGFTCPHCGAPANQGKFYCVSCGGALKEANGASTSSSASSSSGGESAGSSGSESSGGTAS